MERKRVVALPQEGALCVPRPVYPSVCPVPTVNLKTESHTTFKLRAEVTHISSIWQSNFDVKRSRVEGQGYRKCEDHFWRIYLRKIYQFM